MKRLKPKSREHCECVETLGGKRFECSHEVSKRYGAGVPWAYGPGRDNYKPFKQRPDNMADLLEFMEAHGWDQYAEYISYRDYDSDKLVDHDLAGIKLDDRDTQVFHGKGHCEGWLVTVQTLHRVNGKLVYTHVFSIKLFDPTIAEFMSNTLIRYIEGLPFMSVLL